MFDKENNLYAIARNNFQYSSSKEVRVILSNISKCIFELNEKIDFEKLSFLRCGLDEGCRSTALNYVDNINLFNFLAYNGKLIKPDEIIQGDKGIEIDLMENNDADQPVFYELFVD